MNTLTEYAEAVKKAPPNERESLLKEIESFMSSSFVLSGIGAFHWLEHPEGNQFLFVEEKNPL
jgi:hypothetical protein